jgi:hypothetical protein
MSEDSLKSKCCKAPVKVNWGTTHFYSCTLCQQPCDICRELPPIDRESLIKCLQDITSDEGGFPHNPRLCYNRTTGRFSIQSDLLPLDEDEVMISGQLDTSEGLSAFLGDTSPEDCRDLVDAMDDDYIDRYIINGGT